VAEDDCVVEIKIDILRTRKSELAKIRCLKNEAWKRIVRLRWLAAVTIEKCAWAGWSCLVHMAMHVLFRGGESTFNFDLNPVLDRLFIVRTRPGKILTKDGRLHLHRA
jgi:hypothetical protein